MKLLMGQGLSATKIHFGFLLATEHDNILDHAAGWLARNSGQFKAVTVQMDWMDIVALVPHP